MPGSHRGEREQKNDLFDRWLAHREGSAPVTEETAEDAGTGPATPADPPGVAPRPAAPAPPPTARPETATPAADPPPDGREAAQPSVEPERVSTNVEFEARTANRRLVGEILLVIVLLTALAAYFAVSEPTTLTIGLAGTLGVLSLVLWGIRAGAPTVRLSVRAGQLVVVQSGKRMVFDLTSSYTPIEVVGRPRDRDWKVLFLRRGMDPFVIDASMVDPEHFMQVLRQHRPE